MKNRMVFVFLFFASANLFAAQAGLKNYVMGKPLGGLEGELSPSVEGCFAVLEDLNGKEFHVLYEEEEACFFAVRFNALALQDVLVGLENSSKRALPMQDANLRNTIIELAKSNLRNSKVSFKGKRFNILEILD